MDQSFLDNSLWRNIYCLLAGDSAGCSARDYASGLLPGGCLLYTSPSPRD